MRKKYYVWGTGIIAERLLSNSKIDKLDIIGFIDNDIAKQGQIYKGKMIYSPNILSKNKDVYIIIANKYESEIIKQIAKEYPFYKERLFNKNIIIQMELIERYKDTQDQEIQEIISFIQRNGLSVFNYDFVKKYEKIECEVLFDSEKKLFYTMFDNKKMYFSREFDSNDKVIEYYKSIMLEQDQESPHRYLIEDFDVEDGSVVVDAGVAEGNFSLSIIDRVSKIYMFEPDENWCEALRYTFEPYQEKVIIVNKCLSNYIDENTETIDSICNEKIDFIKMDIEGEELYALMGAKKQLMKNQITCVVCTYHQEHAYAAIKTFFEDIGYLTKPSKGYMWFPAQYSNMRPPVLRYGLIRARKEIL